jgi:hypothetical protein
MKSFGGETPYSIMFGPDICGYSTKKVHVILTKGDKNYLVKKEVSEAHDDRATHVYTLAIFPNSTYQVRWLTERALAPTPTPTPHHSAKTMSQDCWQEMQAGGWTSVAYWSVLQGHSGCAFKAHLHWHGRAGQGINAAGPRGCAKLVPSMYRECGRERALLS